MTHNNYIYIAVMALVSYAIRIPVSYTHLDTTQSHDRCSVVEVMGRNAGYIALNVAIASGAMAVLLPEREFDMQRDILDKIAETQKTGKRHFIIIVAEGVGLSLIHI